MRSESPELTVNWKVRINATLAARIEIAMWDPTLQKPKYGSRKALLEHLLREWLATNDSDVVYLENLPAKEPV